MDSYVAEHQDRSRNALAKSHEAAFNSWVEELRADQAQFHAEHILLLSSSLVIVHLSFKSASCKGWRKRLRKPGPSS